jgi:hypothetical protein
MKKPMVLEMVFLCLFGIAILYQLFIPPVTGLADNGDFVRIMDKVGIHAGKGTQYMKYINLDYPIHPTYNLKGYQSSELIFVLVSVGLNSIFSKDGLFHLLTLAGVHSIALLFALGVIALGVSGIVRRKKWLLFACILAFFTDTGYIVYLNSLYSEPASMIFLALTIGIVFLILRQMHNQKVGFIWILAYFVSSVLFTIAKPQNAAMGVLLALLGYRLLQLVRPDDIPQRMINLVGGALAAALIGVSFLFFAFGLPRYYRSGDLWNSVFLEIVGRSATPEQDLKELGLPPEMIVYKGTTAFSENVNRNVYDDFQHSWLYFRVLKFYIVHPDRLLDLMDISASQAFKLQQDNLGNYTVSSGLHSYTKSTKLAIWNRLRVDIFPESIWTFVILFVVNVGAVIIKIRKFDRKVSDRILSELHLAIALMAVFQLFTVLLAEGTFELVKHLFLFNLLVDITFVFLICYLGGIISISVQKISTRSKKEASLLDVP